MFLRRKIVNCICYYDIAESYREDGEVKKRILISLGRCSSVEEAIQSAEYQLKRHLANPHPERARDRNKAEKLRHKLEILRNVVTKASSLQTVNSDYTESLEPVGAAVRP
jgi:signal recognition particle subunit SEC65